jgi:hypothetical protein
VEADRAAQAQADSGQGCFGEPGVASIRYTRLACLVFNAAFEGVHKLLCQSGCGRRVGSHPVVGAHLIKDFPKGRQVTGIAALREITGEEVPPWAKTTPGFGGALAKLLKETDREG